MNFQLKSKRLFQFQFPVTLIMKEYHNKSNYNPINILREIIMQIINNDVLLDTTT